MFDEMVRFEANRKTPLSFADGVEVISYQVQDPQKQNI
jgi:hypothetical protein